MRQPHAATLAGRRSNAAPSSADADARSDCARAAKGEMSWPCTAVMSDGVSDSASKRPVQISDATSAIERVRASARASCPR